MNHVFCKRGWTPIEVGQEWALRVSPMPGYVGFLILRVEAFENEQVSFEVVKAEHQGQECDMIHSSWQQALDRFGYNGKFYFAHAKWNVWDDLMPNRA